MPLKIPFMLSVYQNRIEVLASRKSVLIECVEERIGIEFLNSVNALFGPLAGKEHQCAAHCGNACRVADRLALNFLVALLVIADIVDVISLVLAVLFAREDAADVGLAVCARAEACRIRKKCL